MSRGAVLLVGTRNGAFILDGDAARRSWSIRGPFCEGGRGPSSRACAPTRAGRTGSRATAPSSATRSSRIQPTRRTCGSVSAPSGSSRRATAGRPGTPATGRSRRSRRAAPSSRSTWLRSSRTKRPA